MDSSASSFISDLGLCFEQYLKMARVQMRFMQFPQRTRVRQRGMGFQSALKGLKKLFMPLLFRGLELVKPVAKQTLKDVATESLVRLGDNVIKDVAQGKNVKEALKSRGAEGLKNAKSIIKKGLKESGAKIVQDIKAQAGGRSVIHKKRASAMQPLFAGSAKKRLKKSIFD